MFLTITCLGSGSEVPKDPQVTVNIYNDARVPANVLTEALQEATRIFRKIGVETVWMECQSSKARSEGTSTCHPPSGSTVLALRIVPWSSRIGQAVFGTAFLSAEGEGTYCDVFYDSVKKLHEDWRVSLSRVLGHTIAHEVGHLLLGTNAHSFIGLMRPKWQGPELRRVATGTLLFTPEQGRSIQTKLSSLTAQE
jgi:hypothetical protein